MSGIEQINGSMAPLPFANIDTDIIMPKEFLKSIKRTGFGQHVFAPWRERDDVSIHQPAYQQASIIVAGDNFGCGSSREHAVWGLKEAGFLAVIAPSFADIFYNNCIKNGVLPITLSTHQVDELLVKAQQDPTTSIKIDLPENSILFLEHEWCFSLDQSSQKRLEQGFDDIAMTLQFTDEIERFEQQRKAAEPWNFRD